MDQEKWKDLLWGVRRSVRYHIRRRRFFENVHKWVMVLTSLGGSAAIISLLAEVGDIWTITFAAGVTFFSIIDLVFSTDRQARTHDELARQFIELEKDIIETKKPTEDDLTNLTSCRLSIEMKEPTPLRVLDSICHNELLRAMGYDKSHQLKIKFYQRWFAQIFDIREHTITN